jgi:hypothetical protein
MPTVDNELNEMLLEGQKMTADTSDYGDDLFDTDELEFEQGDYEDFEDDELFDDDFDDFGATELEFLGGLSSVLSTEEEAELAAELASITTEAEMEEFLGKLFKKVKRGVRKIGKKVLPAAKRFIKGPGRKLLSRALPIVGTAVGSALAPGIGTQIGGAAGSAFGSLLGGGGAPGVPQPALPSIPGLPSGGASPLAAMFGGGSNPLAALLGGGGGNPLAALLGSGFGGNILGKLLGGEMESATLYEAKHDLAKRIVRTVAQGTAQAASNPIAARKVLKSAIKKNIPAALRPALVAVPSASGVSGGGQWVRRGNSIIIMGV